MSLLDGLIIGEDGKARCAWHGNDPFYLQYHDHEWGHPVKNDQRLFEKISLEGFQAGLSWLTILRKRENFRTAFDGFNPTVVAQYDEKKIGQLLQDEGIIRHRGKIEAVINNAQKLPDILNEFDSFASYIWSFEPKKELRPSAFDYETLSKITMSEQSKALSKDLKKRGWKFVGPTTCYAFMQSMGVVNDHIAGCILRPIITKARQDFDRP